MPTLVMVVVLLLGNGAVVRGEVVLPVDADCMTTATTVAVDNGAALLGWHCVEERGA